MWNLKKKKKKAINEHIYKTGVELQMQKTNSWFPEGKGGGGVGINWKISIDTHIHTVLYIKQIINKNLLYSTGNCTQHSVMAYMGKESKNVDVCICITDSLCRTLETYTTL